MENNKGFTLVEIMIVIVIIGVIMAYAIPSYQNQVIISKRVEAKNAIMQIASAQEKHNTNFNSYTTEIEGSGVDGDSLGLGGIQFLSSEDYDFSVTIDAALGYIIQADAKGHTQINDTFEADCTSMTLNSLGQKLPLDCWQ